MLRKQLGGLNHHTIGCKGCQFGRKLDWRVCEREHGQFLQFGATSAGRRSLGKFFDNQPGYGGSRQSVISATVLTAEIKSSRDTAVNNTVIIVMGFLKHTVARQP